MELSKSILGLERNLYICAIYIPPENSSYSQKNKGNHEDALMQLNSDIMEYSQKGYILVAGDLNARTGILNDFIINDTDKFQLSQQPYHVDAQVCKRRSQDSTISSRGKELIDLCIGNHLRILNGRKIGDSEGYFTCHKKKGSSTVDYMIVSEELFSRIHYFHVHPLIGTLSDHCKLSCFLRVQLHMHNVKGTNQLIDSPMQFKWEKNSVIAFQSALARPDIIQKSEQFLNDSFSATPNGVNDAVHALHSLIIDVAEISLRRVDKKSSKKTKPNKPWFNMSLTKMKRDVDMLASTLSRCPGNSFIRKKFFDLLKKYNKCRKKQEREYKNTIMQKLELLHTSNPNEFWKLLDKLKNTDKNTNNDQAIRAIEWKDYFKSLSTNKNPNEHSKKIQLVASEAKADQEGNWNLELNKDITRGEITAALKKCKLRKAQGLDGIMNEMLKYGQHVLLPMINKIFNLTLSSGIYPEQWAEGYVKPLFKCGNPLIKDNYRGITVTSCMGKLFNSILNSRLCNFFSELKKENEYQIAYSKNSQTNDHIFLIRTSVDKIVKHGKKKLFCCFVDFKKRWSQQNRIL